MFSISDHGSDFYPQSKIAATIWTLFFESEAPSFPYPKLNTFRKHLKIRDLWPEEVTMNRLTNAVIIALLYGVISSPWAVAESQLSLPADLSGTRQVMKMLRSVNVVRSEQKANQNWQDVLDTKNQLYRQEPLLAPVNTSLSGNARYRYSIKRLPEKYRMPNHQ
jgi:hypothetical protein